MRLANLALLAALAAAGCAQEPPARPPAPPVIQLALVTAGSTEIRMQLDGPAPRGLRYRLARPGTPDLSGEFPAGSREMTRAGLDPGTLHTLLLEGTPGSNARQIRTLAQPLAQVRTLLDAEGADGAASIASAGENVALAWRSRGGAARFSQSPDGGLTWTEPEEPSGFAGGTPPQTAMDARSIALAVSAAGRTAVFFGRTGAAGWFHTAEFAGGSAALCASGDGRFDLVTAAGAWSLAPDGSVIPSARLPAGHTPARAVRCGDRVVVLARNAAGQVLRAWPGGPSWEPLEGGPEIDLAASPPHVASACGPKLSVSVDCSETFAPSGSALAVAFDAGALYAVSGGHLLRSENFRTWRKLAPFPLERARITISGETVVAAAGLEEGLAVARIPIN